MLMLYKFIYAKLSEDLFVYGEINLLEVHFCKSYFVKFLDETFGVIVYFWILSLLRLQIRHQLSQFHFYNLFPT